MPWWRPRIASAQRDPGGGKPQLPLGSGSCPARTRRSATSIRDGQDLPSKGLVDFDPAGNRHPADPGFSLHFLSDGIRRGAGPPCPQMTWPPAPATGTQTMKPYQIRMSRPRFWRCATCAPNSTTRTGTVTRSTGVSFRRRGKASASPSSAKSGSGSESAHGHVAFCGLLAHFPSVAGGLGVADGRDLAGLSERALNAIPGAQVGTVFRDPMSSLDPSV